MFIVAFYFLLFYSMLILYKMFISHVKICDLDSQMAGEHFSVNISIAIILLTNELNIN